MINELNIFSISPILITLSGAMFALVLELIQDSFNKKIYASITLVSLFSALVLTLNLNIPQSGFFNLIQIDALSVLGQLVMLFASILFIFFTLSKENFKEFQRPEFFALFLFVVAGFEIMISSKNLLLILLGLESASLGLYSIIALAHNNKSIESSIKYFTMGAVGSGFFAFGTMLLYASYHTINIGEIQLRADTLSIIGFVFLIVAIGFKMSIIPFHTWVRDVYEGSNPITAFFISIVPKIAIFMVALRMLNVIDDMYLLFITNQILLIAAILTMTIANIIALTQKDVKRMLAYSSISQAGMILCCIVVGGDIGISTMIMYWIFFLFTNAGAFGMLWMASSAKDSNHLYIKYSGALKTDPVFAILMSIFMLSLAGMPPFGMFFGKIDVIMMLLNSELYIIALLVLLNSAIAAFYYLKLVMFMLLRDNANNINYRANNSPSIVFVIIISLFGTVFILPFTQQILDFIFNYLISYNYA